MPKVSINPNNLSALALEIAAVLCPAPGNPAPQGWVEALAGAVCPRPNLSHDTGLELPPALLTKIAQAQSSYIERQRSILRGQGLTFCSDAGLAAFFFSALYESVRFDTDAWNEKVSTPESGRRKRLKRRGAAYFVSPSLAYLAAWRALETYYVERRGQFELPKILDPAMGTGLYLVAALDFMAAKSGDVDAFTAGQCLFGLEIDAITCGAARCALAIAMDRFSSNFDHGARPDLPLDLRANLLWSDALSVSPEHPTFTVGTFDIVLGNPPWDILKNIYSGSDSRTNKARIAGARRGLTFQGEGDTSFYKIFLELSYKWLRPDGVASLLLPAAFCGDKGAAPLRALILDKTRIISLDSFINEDCVFDIHQSFRYVLLVFQKDRPCDTFPYRSGLIAGQSNLTLPVDELTYTPEVIAAIGGKSRALLDLSDAEDQSLLQRTYQRHPDLNSLLGGGRISFRREFDMTVDRSCFIEEKITTEKDFSGDVLPLYEGRMVAQFDPLKADSRPRYSLTRRDFLRRVPEGAFKIGFVSVTSALNTRSVIAAYLPQVPVGNSLPTMVFYDENAAEALCRALYTVAIFNSFPFDWLVRQRLSGTNLNYHLLGDMPFPSPAAGLPEVIFNQYVELSAALSLHTVDFTREIEILGGGASRQFSEIERMRLRIWLEMISLHIYDFSVADAEQILADCTWSPSALARRRRLGASRPAGSEPSPRSFFRVDKALPSEQRLPNLVLTAYRSLGRSASEFARLLGTLDLRREASPPTLPEPVEAALSERFFKQNLSGALRW